MKYFIIILLVVLSFQCTTNNEKNDLENPLELGTNFLRLILNGDFEKANQFLYLDSNSSAYINKTKLEYSQKNREERKLGKMASIIVDEFKENSQDTNTLFFHTSLVDNKDSLLLIKSNTIWKIKLFNKTIF